MYAVVTDIPAPVELYDAAHSAVGRQTGPKIDGLVVHLGRATSSGFQVLEVWESKEHFERFNRDVMGPIMSEMGVGGPPHVVPTPVEFDVRGVVVPAAGLYV